MKKIVLTALIAVLGVLASGCATVNTPYGRRTYVFVQRGIMLELVHECTSKAMVFQAGRGKVADVTGPMPVEIPLEPAIYGDRQIMVTVQSLNEEGNVTQTFSQSFYIDYQSTTAKTWLITASNGGFGGGALMSYCHQ